MIDGIANYKLYANQLGNTLTDLILDIKVYYSVEVGWSEVDRCPTIESAKADGIEVYIDGKCYSDLDWTDVTGGLRDFILKESKRLTFEEMGITDAEAREALSEEAAHREFLNDHRAGAI